jgi:hypothetical protein
VFAFTRELVNGRIRGFESSRIAGAIDFQHELQAEEFTITDALFKAFRDFVAADRGFKVTAVMIDRNRSFVETELRFNIATAAYGRVIADRVFIMSNDPQIAKALEVVPKARELTNGRASKR